MGLFTSKSSKNSTKTPVQHIDGDVESNTIAIGKQLLEDASAHKSGLFSAKAWSEKLMDFAMRDHGFKVQMFRYVDVFPTLKSPESIYNVLMDYMSQPGVTAPPFLSATLSAGSLAKGIVAKTITSQITSMAKTFIAGTDAGSALPKLTQLWEGNMGFSVDLLGEVCVSQAEAEDYQRQYLELINTLPGHTSKWAYRETLETDHLGEVPRNNVSVKISSLLPNIKPQATDYCIEQLFEIIKPILIAAGKQKVLINFDMESHSLKDLTIALFKKCCGEIDYPAGIAMQAYLRSGEADAADLIGWAQKLNRQVTVRLIKGAYWDYETIRAEEMGWPVPVWSRKQDTDACFERMAELFIKNTPKEKGQGGVKLALGSHNLRSIAWAKAQLVKHELPGSALEYQMLEGMADHLKHALVKGNDRLRIYIPVGEMIPGMAYLVRRLLENTSNESWLRGSGKEEVKAEELLKSPHPGAGRATDDLGGHVQAAARHALSAVHKDVANKEAFFTEPMRDFSDAKQRDAFREGIERATIRPVKIDVTEAQLEEALAQARAAFAGWRDTGAAKRANMMVKAAEIMRGRRDELAGLIIKESGKTWKEADGDVCEAIDFYEYYAREAMELAEPRRLGKFIGELNQLRHEPIGVAAIISPWNFPLAICAGMTGAALVTGNPTIVKPAEQTPAIAKLMCDILYEAGVPRDVLHFLPGAGETIGAALVRDPRVAIIGFTGSREVGFNILNAASTIHPMQTDLKRVVCEMGGKNAIIVDATADLDEAVIGVRDSAFNFAGQKCSACSRVIVVGEAYESFISRLVEATRVLKVGDPIEASTDIGPVIDQDAADKINSYIEMGKTEGRCIFAGELTGEHERISAEIGLPFVAPHIFTDVLPSARIATEEIFGPVLAVIRVDTFDEALKVANESIYKLTGAVYTRTPVNLERARREFRVGNLYLNRGSTGALVGRQPFGGFGHSGLGTKAGGKDYLRNFVNPINVTENTMRRGFAPDLES